MTRRYSSSFCSTSERSSPGSSRTSKVVMTMDKKRKKGKRIPTYEEWYEAHREQFERTDRLYEEAKLRWAKEAEERAAREAAARAEDAA